jgi:hypothetical protein
MLQSASVDHTEARNDILGCFGRSDRSELIPGDDITPDERGVMMRNLAQFRPGVGPGLGQGFRAKQKLGPDGPLPLSGGTWQAVPGRCRGC